MPEQDDRIVCGSGTIQMFYQYNQPGFVGPFEAGGGWGMCTSHYAQTLPIHKVGYKAKYKCGEADNGQGVDVFGNDMNKVIKVGVK